MEQNINPIIISASALIKARKSLSWLEDAAGIRRIVLACGTVGLRKGIDGLAMIIGVRYRQNLFEKGTLFLFCGKRSDRYKGLLWMGLLYKRFEDGRMS